MPGRFEGRKLITVGGSSGMGKENAADVVAEGGSVVIVGRDKGRVDETVAELSNRAKPSGSPLTSPIGPKSRTCASSWPPIMLTRRCWSTPRASSSPSRSSSTTASSTTPIWS
jgi:hypothetical protein